MSTAAPRIPAYTSLVLSGVRGAADQEQHGVTGDMIDKAKQGRTVLDTPSRPLTTTPCVEGRPLVTDVTGRRADMSRRAPKSAQKRDPALYQDTSAHTDRLVGIRAYRLGCRCDNCKQVLRAERAKARALRKPRSYPQSAVQQRRHKLKFAYGITPEQYDEMVEKQSGLCAICRKGQKNSKPLYVDHDHYTGQVRGLLCSTCNVWLGRIDDDPAKVTNALEYLREDTATQLQLKCFDKSYYPGGAA